MHKFLAVFISFVFAVSSYSDDTKNISSIMLIGNSFFYYNNSLHNHLGDLYDADPDLDTPRRRSITINGSSFSWHDVESYLSNKEIGSLLKEFNVNAATDVTGYGLIGHLYEMCKASNVSAEIEISKVPFFNNVKQFAKKGAVPGGTRRNLDFFSKHIEFEESIQNHQKFMLADAQTSGGLLISLSECLNILFL